MSYNDPQKTVLNSIYLESTGNSCAEEHNCATFPSNNSLDWLSPSVTYTAPTKSQKLIQDECDSIKNLLLEKNRKYGDSALNPSRIFSRSDAIEQIKVRIDDKLSRLKNQQEDEDEDVEQDLIGYLVLLRVARRRAEDAKKVYIPEYFTEIGQTFTEDRDIFLKNIN